MKNDFFKINLYKNALIKFIKLNNDETKEFDNKNNVEILIGILFLTEMNRYCKKNNIQVHGYYIAYSLINFFIKIKNMLYLSGEISALEILNLIKNISINIEYLNSRVDNTNKIKKKINYNYHSFMIELSKNIEELIEQSKTEFIKDSHEKELKNSLILKNFKKRDENILSKFFFILLMIAKYVGTGEYDEPNLIKLGQYYSNIFLIYLRLIFKIGISDSESSIESESKSTISYFMKHKTILINSIINLQYHSDTVDEIINYIENEINVVVEVNK